MKVLLQTMSWPEAKEYFEENEIALLPVGSNEQHGPHNPLGTDHLIAKAIAEETAKRIGVLCLPVVPFGVSSHHKQFWGTIFLSPKTFSHYVKEVCLALHYYGVTKIVVVNGHGGNLSALTEMSRELRGKGIFVSIFQWWTAANNLLPDLLEEEEQGHAAAGETSLNLALHPEIVNHSRAVDEEPHRHNINLDGVTLPLDTLDYTSSGVFGRSTTASTQKGKTILEAVVKALARHASLLREAKIEDLLEKPKI